MLLPFLLTRNWRSLSFSALLSPGKWLPLLSVVLSLVVGAMMGGAGSLTFQVPALIWCAIVLPIPVTSLVILLTGITAIVMVSHGVMNIQGNDNLLPLSHLTSARLGVATIAISPNATAATRRHPPSERWHWPATWRDPPRRTCHYTLLFNWLACWCRSSASSINRVIRSR